MIADMQRARMMCRHLLEHGWEAEVLAPDLSHQPLQCIEPQAAQFFDPGIPFHAASPRGGKCWDFVGSSTLAWRGFWPVLSEGSGLLRGGRYDLVFFSTAHYMLTLAGCSWRKRHGVPFVIDLHDPWHARSVPRPELARGLRGRILTTVAARSERAVLSAACGVISVSPSYLEAITRHYGAEVFGWQKTGCHRVEPFAYEPAETAAARRAVSDNAADGDSATISYCGAGGRVMRASWRVLCQALADLKSRDSSLLESVRFVFKGTSLHYREGDSLEMVEAAREEGVAHLVSEDPTRISYGDSIQLVVGAEGVLILGVDDPGYMASKLFSYLSAGKPLLAVLRTGSVMVPFLQGCPGVTVLEFGPDGSPGQETSEKLRSYLADVRTKRVFNREAALAARSASAMTQRLVQCFESCVA